jgi:hypothetical protein
LKALKIIKNILEWKKLWPPKVEGSRILKKPLNATKIDFGTPKKFLVCCFVAIKVQR